MDLSSSSSPAQSHDNESLDSPVSAKNTLTLDVNQNLLHQNPRPNKTLEQVDAKCENNDPLYRLWLYLMVIASGLFVLYTVGLIYSSWRDDYNFYSKSFMLGFFVYSIGIFAQFLLEILAIANRDLSKANLALILMTINSFIFLGSTKFCN